MPITRIKKDVKETHQDQIHLANQSIPCEAFYVAPTARGVKSFVKAKVHATIDELQRSNLNSNILLRVINCVWLFQLQSNKKS